MNPQNNQYTVEIIENDLNIPKLSINTLDFLVFGGILVEEYILIILDVLGILFVYQVSRFDR